MAFLRHWFGGIIDPAHTLDELKAKPAPMWGFVAVLIRFAGTSLTTTPLALVLRVSPFQPSYLTFLPTDVYYQYQPFFFPFFGLGVWLLMSAVAHTALRQTGRPSDFDQVLNIVGLGMLIPMPVVWLWDSAMMGLNTFQLTTMSISHSLFQLWEVAVEALGFRKILSLAGFPAIVVSVLINLIFVLLAMMFVR